MQKISIEEFATKTVERNKDLNREELIQSLQSGADYTGQGLNQRHSATQHHAGSGQLSYFRHAYHWAK